MTEFERGFYEELEKIAKDVKPYSMEYAGVESPEEVAAVRNLITKRLALLAGLPGGAVMGAAAGAERGPKGALAGAALGGLAGAGLGAGLGRVLPVRAARTFHDPTGAYESFWKRPEMSEFYVGPGGTKEPAGTIA
jgi:hypothetical protein